MSSNSVAASVPKTTASSSKPRKVKPKHVDTVPLEELVAVEADVDAPPPPYIDDGSHDLLQEVLAIEREKDEEKRQRSMLKAPERAVNGSSGKRKHSATEEEKVVNGSSAKRKHSTAEDDILALATPAKKEKPTPAVVSTSTSSSSNGKLILPALKFSKPKKDLTGGSSSRSTSARSTPAVDAPRPSLKGKEKEIPLPATPTVTTPKPRNQPTVHATPINDKKCKDILKVLSKISESTIFQTPVDPVRDGCPTYVYHLSNLLLYSKAV